MNAIDWLHANAPGFRELSEAERNAIMEFSLLWSLFEARALGTHGSAATILDTTRWWAERGLLAPDSFAPALFYFRNRYYADGAFTYRFTQLNLRRPDQPELIKSVLAGESEVPADVAATLLIIIYRFRNNLLHGVKWAYEIRGQFDNFSHANSALMKAIELNERCDLMGKEAANHLL